MDVFDTPGAIRDWSLRRRVEGRRVAVVPTMGALHRGHEALVAEAERRADVVIATIFVNPLQFNLSSDFETYPRPIDDDLRKCEAIGVDAVFAPTAATMYPAGFQTHVEPGELADRLEGLMRPGHFRGVLTVVAKLFGATMPHVGVFGQKDYQQLAIVRRMAADLDLGIEIVAAPTVREDDGLALSSRNRRLAPEDRVAALAIPRGLTAGLAAFEAGERDASVVRSIVEERIEAEPRAKLEYVEVVDAGSLAPLERISSDAVVLTAAWLGDVRLIDNRLLPVEPGDDR